jgi:8-oxo-dGTP pyrophosphatase MutT (NUDIX family)
LILAPEKPTIVVNKGAKLERLFKQYTLAYFRDGNMVLLGKKKKGYGRGFVNGYGGKINSGESVEEALIREVLEESGLRPVSFEKSGILFYNDSSKQTVTELHIFLVTKFEGNLIESDEMIPLWVDINRLPFSKMWPTDRFWLEDFLSGKKFVGQIRETPMGKLEPCIKIVDNIDENICVMEKRYLISK